MDNEKESGNILADLTVTERLGIPAVMLTAMYGMYDITLRSISMWIERRDIVLGVGKSACERISAEHGKLIILTELIGQWFGFLFFIFASGAVMYWLPKYLLFDKELGKIINWKKWFKIAASLVFIGAVMYIISGIYSFTALYKATFGMAR